MPAVQCSNLFHRYCQTISLETVTQSATKRADIGLPNKSENFGPTIIEFFVSVLYRYQVNMPEHFSVDLKFPYLQTIF